MARGLKTWSKCRDHVVACPALFICEGKTVKRKMLNMQSDLSFFPYSIVCCVQVHGVKLVLNPSSLGESNTLDLRRLALERYTHPQDLLAMERYTHLEDLLDGEPWEEADLAPGPRDLVVRLGGLADGYRRDQARRPRIVQVVGGPQGAGGQEGAWLAQCGLNSCSSMCRIM